MLLLMLQICIHSPIEILRYYTSRYHVSHSRIHPFECNHLFRVMSQQMLQRFGERFFIVSSVLLPNDLLKMSTVCIIYVLTILKLGVSVIQL